VAASVALAGCGGSTENGPFVGTPPAPQFTVRNKVAGFCLGPFVLEGQDPNYGTDVPTRQLRYLIRDAAQYATWIRTFGTSGTLQEAGACIHEAGARAMIGAYLAKPSNDTTVQANREELDRLIAMANAGDADIVTVGNETLLTGALTEDQLLAYIAYVRARVPAAVSVSTVDTWSELTGHPNVVAACDVVCATVYPFWENVPISEAMARLRSDYAAICAAAGGKQVIVAETGWPSAGAPPYQAPKAVPSEANQLTFFLQAEQGAKENGIVLIWFEAFSEPWKASHNDYASWGVFDSARYVIDPRFAGAFE
jgi:GPH family glycoside/pentoside/hexuronide:cation symporter